MMFLISKLSQQLLEQTSQAGIHKHATLSNRNTLVVKQQKGRSVLEAAFMLGTLGASPVCAQHTRQGQERKDRMLLVKGWYGGENGGLGPRALHSSYILLAHRVTLWQCVTERTCLLDKSVR